MYSMDKDYIFKNEIERDDIAIGIVVVEGISMEFEHTILNQKIEELINQRKGKELEGDPEERRLRSRDILRNGKYRPTGRGKPASEYLLRSAKTGEFPRINFAVDINNYISLKHMVAISLWDLDLSETSTYIFRLGREDESYIFNTANQEIGLRDLIIGVAQKNGQEIPIINPIKDSMQTKTVDSSSNIALAVYFPLKAGGKKYLEDILSEIKELFKYATPKRSLHKIL